MDVPAAGRLDTPAGNLLIAAGMAAIGAGGVFAELREAPPPPAPPYWGLLIGAAAGGLLWWRRRNPIVATCGIVGLCLLYHLLGYPGLAPAVSLFVAVYAVTAYATRRRLLLAIGLIVVTAVIPVLPPDPAGFNPGALFGPPMAMIGIATMGEAARVQRANTAERLEATRRVAQQEARRQLAEQRLEIARELHDVLAHTITMISVQAAVGAEALEERPRDAAAALATIRGAARDALVELGSTLAELRTGETDTITPPQPGLADLNRLTEQATANGLEVHLASTGEPHQLPAAVELAIYRIVQESLTNTTRHSQAGSASVALTHTPGHVIVEVTDHGPAAPTKPDATHTPHGLIGMHERVRLLGGTLDAGPAPDGGYRVVAELPLRSSL